MFTEEVMMIGEIDFVDVSQAIEEFGYYHLIFLIDAKEGGLELAIQFNKIADENKVYFLNDEYVFSKNERHQAINRLVDYVVFEPIMVEDIIKAGISYDDGLFFLDGKKMSSVTWGHMFVYEKGLRRSIWGDFQLNKSRPFRLYITKKQYETMKKNKEETDFCNQLEKEGHTLASLYRQLNNNETQKRQVDYKQLREWQERAAIEDGKPTAEQLQQQLDAAKARIAELEAMQAQPVPHNQPNELQQPYPCLQPIADIIEEFKHNKDFVKYGQGIQQQIIENWLRCEHKKTTHEARSIKALITAHYNITT
jgi:hypothetical protein